MTAGTAITIACAGLLSLSSQTRAQAVDEHRRAWRAVRPPNYQFEYRMECFCAGSGGWWRITVHGDSVADVQSLDSAAARHGVDIARQPAHPTIDQLFANLARTSVSHQGIVDVTYDPSWSYPVAIYVNVDTTWYDLAYRIQIRHFHSIP